VVTIDALAPVPGRPISFSWDDHADAQPGWDLAEGMRWRAPFLDQALSTLIEDLPQRGLSREVLVLTLGEFSRTPRLTHNNGRLGRDHWPQAAGWRRGTTAQRQEETRLVTRESDGQPAFPDKPDGVLI
jgi:hypothetical protein